MAPITGAAVRKENSTLESWEKATATNSHSEIASSGVWGTGEGIQHRTEDNVKVTYNDCIHVREHSNTFITKMQTTPSHNDTKIQAAVQCTRVL